MESWTDHVEAMIRNVLSEGSEEKKNNAIASVLRVMASELLRLQGSHKDLQSKNANRDSEIASLRDGLREHVIQPYPCRNLVLQ